jgi:CBS domain-containing protein
MNVKDAMTKDVVTVEPRTPLKEVARILSNGTCPACRSSTRTEPCSEWSPKATSSPRSAA